jgi:hypothetical protein
MGRDFDARIGKAVGKSESVPGILEWVGHGGTGVTQPLNKQLPSLEKFFSSIN